VEKARKATDRESEEKILACEARDGNIDVESE